MSRAAARADTVNAKNGPKASVASMLVKYSPGTDACIVSSSTGTAVPCRDLAKQFAACEKRDAGQRRLVTRCER